jgi:Spy/CpxP family protein refolding chaperone
MNSPWKLTLLLVGIFLAGAVTGGMVTKGYLRKEIAKRFAPEQMGKDRLAKLTKRLDLTPEQVEQIKPILQRDTAELIRTVRTSFAESRRIATRMDREISAVLTPEQKAKFDKMIQERRQNVRRMFGGGNGGKPANEPEDSDDPTGTNPTTKPASAGN